ncbi:magnesium transporter MRS2-11 chloroplastic [Tripterygium wilfordii]|uniref:Magnesium transporter n=1 Tax=Tripterygium wilfordii TaxID=458696 RepID=A0A7J7DZ35_TRIWF|nr:magnesium transporter MRS2-11, chloroplastic [Tripterygium wilfordii]KAF5751587.1 magnesium transporter MRS2-11 chloroplastic [Tripterygium wilfordii]
MALTPPSSPHLLHIPFHSPSLSSHHFLFFHSPWHSPPSPAVSLQKCAIPLLPIAVKFSKCFAKSTAEDHLSEPETITNYEDGDREDRKVQNKQSSERIDADAMGYSESPTLGIREPVYEVVEVKPNGMVSTRKINRRQLLKSSGLRPRDIRSVDPSLFLTNSVPSLLVREHAILLNLGSLRAIAMQEHVLIFDYNCKGGKAFMDTLLPRLNPKNINGAPCMPFELEVVEAALLSRVQRLEQRLMDLEPRVQRLLEVLPNRLTADILEQLRISKQHLVELGSRAGALRQMLLDLLEDPHEIRRICIMGRNCTLKKGNDDLECSVPLEKQIAEEEEEEIEMLLENYLQRCESCHGQAERLLDSAKEMEDSIAVNLSSRRLEVSRVELLLQVGTFCVAIGALVAGIFGMNLRSYLEEHAFAFWLTTVGIIVGAIVAFFFMYSYLRTRKIL